MTSNYQLFRQAMLAGKQVFFKYQGYSRETCPHTLGLKKGQEKALTFQFGGGSSSGLPPGGQWRCLFLSEVTDVTIHDGPWHTAGNHSQPQTCVDEIDLEIRMGPNGQTPYVVKA